MRKGILIIAGIVTSFVLGYFLNFAYALTSGNKEEQSKKVEVTDNPKLGAFSVSLSVRDLKASKEFYEKMGFSILGGSMEKNYLIMKNERALIGLFQGMFQGNILTFNPGWDENGQNVKKFDDIRVIQMQLKQSGLTLTSEAEEGSTGPASLTLTDPDGNIILIDQHR